MVKGLKFLIIIVVVIFILGMLGVGYVYFTKQKVADELTNDAAKVDTTLAPREELFKKYFVQSALTKEVYNTSENVGITWQLKPGIPVTTKFLVKLVDKNQSIFIAETEATEVAVYNGAQIKNPGKAGEYEAWVYLIEDGSIQLLTQVLPFSVK